MKKIVIIIAALSVTAFAWWTISPLFINKTVEDTLPEDVRVLLENDSVSPQKEEGNPLETSKGLLSEDTSIPSRQPVVAPESEVPLQPTVLGPFTIEDTPGHSASGAVRVINTPDEGAIVRYENYKGTNGPDLYVYLAKDLDATEFVSLGRAKGNVGNINYEVPNDIDLSEYKYVMTWCKAFGVLFDYSEIK